MSFVAVSWIQPTLTAESTWVGVTRVLEAGEVCPEARFYQASSQRDVRKVAGAAERGPRRSTHHPYGVGKVTAISR